MCNQKKVCSICKSEKSIKEFNSNKAYCKVCDWFKRNNNKIIIEEKWTIEEYKIIIDNLLNEKVHCINDIVIMLNNKTLEDLIVLIENNIKLRGKTVKVKYNCECCGKIDYSVISQYRKTKNHFCSKECYDNWQNTSIKTKCSNCGKTIYVRKGKYELNNHNFCSNNCAKDYNKKNHIFGTLEVKKVTYKCECCGKEATQTEKLYNRANHHYCSIECHQKMLKEHTPKGIDNSRFTSELVKCTWCGKEFYKIPSRINNTSENHFCCRNCTEEWYRNIYVKDEKVIKERRQRMLKILNDGLIPKTRTVPHNKIIELLKKYNLTVEEEANFNYYSIDILVNKKYMIEIMGGFWHCDVRKYPVINYKNQKETIQKDKAKHTYMKKYYNMEILYLWEDDINNNIELCKKLISTYISNRGILLNYHSFNYINNDENLLLKENMIMPYMEWNSDDINKIVDIKLKKIISRKQQNKWVKVNCDYCNTEFEILSYHYNRSKNHFCCVECKNNFQKKRINVICEKCGKEFSVIESKYNSSVSKKFYCSSNCYNNRAEKVKCNCDYCGKEITMKPGKYKESNKHFCNDKCCTLYRKKYLIRNDKGQFVNF